MPSDGIFPSTTNATFNCQHPNATSVTWRLNGTLLRDLKLENTTSIGKSGGKGIFYTLTILALSIYNGTTVECIATGIQHPSNVMSSPSVTLLIQGLQ